jgi:tRNA1(Val) A37 N6-methylase TrmN6
MTKSDAPGVIREARRPLGWRSFGPAPCGDVTHPDLLPQAGEDLCYLVGDWRIFQRQSGHRWSLDDLITAWLARQAAHELGHEPQRILDLGCGIGSVLLMEAWSFPSATCVGIEAQAISIALARRSIRYNGIEDRVRVIAGDFRDSLLTTSERFDLITGTPPYFKTQAGLVSRGEQKGPCRFEMRGGVEAYIETAAHLLSPEGIFVLCAAHEQRSRILEAAAAHELAPWCQMIVIPKEGKSPLLTMAVLRRSQPQSPSAIERPALIVRDAGGQRTPAMQALRSSMSIPP